MTTDKKYVVCTAFGRTPEPMTFAEAQAEWRKAEGIPASIRPIDFVLAEEARQAAASK